jgi:hypothetical protein
VRGAEEQKKRKKRGRSRGGGGAVWCSGVACEIAAGVLHAAEKAAAKCEVRVSERNQAYLWEPDIMACRSKSAAPLRGPPWFWLAVSYGLAMLLEALAVVVEVFPSQLRWLRTLRWLAALGRLEEAREEAAVLVAVGLPRGLGAKGTMLMVLSVGMALADFVETCPGRRPGERGGFNGVSRGSLPRFLSGWLESV